MRIKRKGCEAIRSNCFCAVLRMVLIAHAHSDISILLTVPADAL
jgi:hypothetical protein